MSVSQFSEVVCTDDRTALHSGPGDGILAPQGGGDRQKANHPTTKDLGSALKAAGEADHCGPQPEMQSLNRGGWGLDGLDCKGRFGDDPGHHDRSSGDRCTGPVWARRGRDDGNGGAPADASAEQPPGNGEVVEGGPREDLPRGPHLWASALFDEVVPLGYGASYVSFARQLRRAGAGLRPHCEPCAGVSGRPTIEIDHPAGAERQWYWFERRKAPWGGTADVLLGTLPHSSRVRGVLAESLDQPHLIEAIDAVLRRFGGTPRPRLLPRGAPRGADRADVAFESAPDGIALERLVLEDLGSGRTRLTVTSLVESFEARDAFLASGMEHGVREAYQRLDELLAD